MKTTKKTATAFATAAATTALALATPLLLSPTAQASTAAPATAATAARDNCKAFNTISAPPYYLNNNVWGVKPGVTGKQCTNLISYRGGKLAWDTNFEWTGDKTSVKSYASAVLGWHWGWKQNNTKLPVRLNSGKKVTSNWTFGITQNTPTVMNVSYDLWFHAKSNPDWQDQPKHEMMVWLNRQNGAGPLGTKRETLNVGGVNWDLYVGKIVNKDNSGKVTSSWNVYSYVRTTNTTTQTTDLTALTQALLNRKLMASTDYLTSVEAGTEVFTGKGKLTTSSYSVSVN
ncbi:Cellulase [Actinobacteria bacterium OK074]|nr:Cellulase [Actinobacteria bacterium OK074]